MSRSFSGSPWINANTGQETHQRLVVQCGATQWVAAHPQPSYARTTSWSMAPKIETPLASFISIRTRSPKLR